MGKRELVILLSLSSWCLVIVVRLFLFVPWVCLQFVIVIFPDHTLLFFFYILCQADGSHEITSLIEYSISLFTFLKQLTGILLR